MIQFPNFGIKVRLHNILINRERLRKLIFFMNYLWKLSGTAEMETTYSYLRHRKHPVALFQPHNTTNLINIKKYLLSEKYYREQIENTGKKLIKLIIDTLISISIS